MRISITIPTYNESLCLPETLSHLKTLVGDFEVIVVDGKSNDKTPEVARSAGVLTAESKRGRAFQMNYGASLAEGDVLLFLHADTRLPEDAYSLIKAALGNPQIAGGCFRLRFDNDHWGLRFFGYMSRFSFPLFHYGDAAYFVRRSVFEELGGYRPYPIMEDLELWLRMRRRHDVQVLRTPVVTSSRRFIRNGVFRQQFLNVLLVLLFLLGVSPGKLMGFYSEVRAANPSEDLFRFRPLTILDELWYPIRTIWHWTYSNLHLALQTYYVLDFMWLHRLKAGMLADNHPWATGLMPDTDDLIWDKNIVFASPPKPEWHGLAPDADDVIVTRIGKFLITMVKRSIVSDPEIPQGSKRRMPHGVNYIHGTINYNSGYMIFNDFRDGMFYLSDPNFVREMKRFAKEQKRELTLVFRERDYDPEEFAWFVTFVRSHLPWYANGNGPTKKRVLWGTPSPYAAVNPINGSWVLDMKYLYLGQMDKLVRPPIERKYFQGEYRGNQYEYSFMERFHAWAQNLIIKAKGFQGGLVFTKRRRIEPENWKKYEETGGKWQASYSVSHPFKEIEKVRAERGKPIE